MLIVENKALADNLGYARIGTFADTKVVTQFREVLPQLQQHQGLVLDIRHNGGGNTFIAEEILKHLSFVSLIGAKSKMRVHNSTTLPSLDVSVDCGLYPTGDCGDCGGVLPHSPRAI